jgi:hypothetical protein
MEELVGVETWMREDARMHVDKVHNWFKAILSLTNISTLDRGIGQIRYEHSQ